MINAHRAVRVLEGVVTVYFSPGVVYQPLDIVVRDDRGEESLWGRSIIGSFGRIC